MKNGAAEVDGHAVPGSVTPFVPGGDTPQQDA